MNSTGEAIPGNPAQNIKAEQLGLRQKEIAPETVLVLKYTELNNQIEREDFGKLMQRCIDQSPDVRRGAPSGDRLNRKYRYNHVEKDEIVYIVFLEGCKLAFITKMHKDAEKLLLVGRKADTTLIAVIDTAVAVKTFPKTDENTVFDLYALVAA